MAVERAFRFAVDGDSCINLAGDRRIALLAVCVASQQGAGFGDYLDLRQVECPACRAPGFNTGWGAWRFTCGAEVLGGEDVDFTEPCGAKTEAA